MSDSPTVRVFLVAPIGDTGDGLLLAPLGDAVPCRHIRAADDAPATHSAWFGNVPATIAERLLSTALAHPAHQTMDGVAVAVWADPDPAVLKITAAAGFSLNTVGRPWDDTEALAGLGLRRMATVGAVQPAGTTTPAPEPTPMAEAEVVAETITAVTAEAVASTPAVPPVPVAAPTAPAAPSPAAKPSWQNLLKKK